VVVLSQVGGGFSGVGVYDLSLDPPTGSVIVGVFGGGGGSSWGAGEIA